MIYLKAKYRGKTYSISYLNYDTNHILLCDEAMKNQFMVRIDEITEFLIPPPPKKKKK